MAADEPLFVPHRVAQTALGVRPSFYWAKLVRPGRVLVVGKGRASRAFWPSIKDYADELITEAEAERAKKVLAQSGKAA